MKTEIEEDGDGILEDRVVYTDEELAEIIARMPTKAKLRLLGKPLYRPDLLALRDITAAANNYIVARDRAPKRYDMQNIADDRNKRLGEIDGVIDTASTVGDIALVESLKLFRSKFERPSWWEEQFDPRKDKHQKAFVGAVFAAWARLNDIPLHKCRMSVNDTSPMLKFVQAATDPVFTKIGKGIGSDMIMRLWREAKKVE